MTYRFPGLEVPSVALTPIVALIPVSILSHAVTWPRHILYVVLVLLVQLLGGTVAVLDIVYRACFDSGL